MGQCLMAHRVYCMPLLNRGRGNIQMESSSLTMSLSFYFTSSSSSSSLQGPTQLLEVCVYVRVYVVLEMVLRYAGKASFGWIYENKVNAHFAASF